MIQNTPQPRRINRRLHQRGSSCPLNPARSSATMSSTISSLSSYASASHSIRSHAIHMRLNTISGTAGPSRNNAQEYLRPLLPRNHKFAKLLSGLDHIVLRERNMLGRGYIYTRKTLFTRLQGLRITEDFGFLSVWRWRIRDDRRLFRRWKK